MIQITCKRNKFTYNVYHITKAFFPAEEIQQKVDEKQEPLVVLTLPGGSCFSLAEEELAESGNPAFSGSGTLTLEERAQEEKREVTRRVYRFLSEAAGRGLAWGTLTGVRPTKLATRMLEQGKSKKEITQFLQEEYFVSEEKAELSYAVALRENALLSRMNPRGGFSLYVGIPFCPSVCSYCSFSSSPIDQWRDQVDAYLDALVRELEELGRLAAGWGPDAVYIGGGTPTVLEPGQLRRVLEAVTGSFDLRSTLEFTVEAGRPDSITEEKLAVLKEFPVTRISINPQTMQQKTLDLVGRRHTPDDVRETFALARSLGFDNINMDLIAGLPGETVADMQDTLRQIEAMRPDSLTVHSLAIKRAARFGQEGRTMDLHTDISRMVDDAADSAARMGLAPYYLYRQKNIAGNFENVGYAELDKAGIYNILIMEEKQTILGAGAGASTKILLKDPVRTEQGKQIDIVHVENVKNILEYISRVDEMTERKRRAGFPACLGNTAEEMRGEQLWH